MQSLLEQSASFAYGVMVYQLNDRALPSLWVRTGVEHDTHLAKNCIKLPLLAILGLVKISEVGKSFLVNRLVRKSLLRFV
ncbi:MAG: hypothetical protein ACR2QH_09740 [Geminicoccaceae bacterium]